MVLPSANNVTDRGCPPWSTKSAYVWAVLHGQGHRECHQQRQPQVDRILPAGRQESAELLARSSCRAHGRRRRSCAPIRCGVQGFRTRPTRASTTACCRTRCCSSSAGAIQFVLVPKQQERRSAHRGYRQQLRLGRHVRDRQHPPPAAGQRRTQLLQAGVGRHAQLQVRRRGDARHARAAVQGIPQPHQ